MAGSGPKDSARGLGRRLPARYRVALQGFSEFERTTLMYCINHATTRDPGYVQVELIADCDFIVADASHEAIAGSATRGARMRDTLFVGDNPPLGARAQIPRPIDPERILRALDRMAAQRGSRGERPDIVLPLAAPDPRAERHAGSEIADTTPAAFHHEPVSVVFTDLEPLLDVAAAPALPPSTDAASLPTPTPGQQQAEAGMPASPVGPAPRSRTAPAKAVRPVRPIRATADERAAAKAAARRASRQARLLQTQGAASGAPHDVLVLDPTPGPVALSSVLEAFGFTVHHADDVAAAMAILERTALAAAFIDPSAQDVTGIDGLDLCQRIKHRQVPMAGATPAVMLTADRDSASGRVRASLAGCDVFLVRPIERGDAARALESCKVALPADARGA